MGMVFFRAECLQRVTRAALSFSIVNLGAARWVDPCCVDPAVQRSKQSLPGRCTYRRSTTAMLARTSRVHKGGGSHMNDFECPADAPMPGGGKTRVGIYTVHEIAAEYLWCGQCSADKAARLCMYVSTALCQHLFISYKFRLGAWGHPSRTTKLNSMQSRIHTNVAFRCVHAIVRDTHKQQPSFFFFLPRHAPLRPPCVDARRLD